MFPDHQVIYYIDLKTGYVHAGVCKVGSEESKIGYQFDRYGYKDGPHKCQVIHSPDEREPIEEE